VDRELKRGTLEMIILDLLTERPMYGFELITEMRERSGGGFEMKEGTLYPVLYRMEENGYVKPEWDTAARGAPRKYYHISHAGKREHERLIQEWETFTTAIADILYGAERTGKRRGA
jgi:PadR family transcriptional regulator PadR